MKFDAQWRAKPSPSQPAIGPKPSLLTSLDHAVSEIAARQRALNEGYSNQKYQEQSERIAATLRAESPVGPNRLAATAAATAHDGTPGPDLSGLEEQLRKIADQIETLLHPGAEEAIRTLRTELDNIGRALSDAMPRRAIQVVEDRIQDLGRRVTEGRHAGVKIDTLNNIEYGLAEVREALRSLMPAEKLAGFHQAINNLAQKIDLIIAQNDPITLRQLENTITTLCYLVDHVASSKAVSRLATDVERLADKIDHVVHADIGSGALDNPEHRGDALADKNDRHQGLRGDNVARGQLEELIVALVHRLDASASHLSHLDAIERGIADLLFHIEELQASKNDAACADHSPAVDGLNHELARAQDRPEVVDGTLGQLLERLAAIEQDGHSKKGASPIERTDLWEFAGSADKVPMRLAGDYPGMAPKSASPEMAVPSSSATIAADVERVAVPADTVTEHGALMPPAPGQMAPPSWQADPPAVLRDQPLEPDSGPPDLRTNPAAASSRSSFIAAARRAAQAAAQQQGGSVRWTAREATGEPSLGAKVVRGVKALVIAASIAAIVVGSLQIVGGEFGFNFAGPALKIAQRLVIKGHDEVVALVHRLTIGHSEKIAAVPKAKPQATVRPFAERAQQTQASRISPPAQPGPMPQLASLPPAQNNLASQAMSLLSPPPTAADSTGSIPDAATIKAPEPGPARTAHHSQERLPTSISAPQLRDAALAGNAAAAYEVAMRFEQGRGVPVNLAAAAHWFKRAASKGLAPAQFHYASMLERGQGVRKDLDSARRLYLAAAVQGNAKAMHNLAVLDAEGIDGKSDYAAAAKWFTQAAQHGISDSQYNLGVLYGRGVGVTMNLSESYKWFALAAAHGDKEAAKKRDAVAARLDPKELARARQAVAKFAVTPEPRSATIVAEPPGGWGKPAAISTRS